MEVILNIECGEKRRQVTMSGERLTLGRSPECSVVLTTDEGLSRHHAAIHREGDELRLTDCQSVNGTYLNCELVRPEGATLINGDEIFIGNRTIVKVSVMPRSRGGATAHERHNVTSLSLFFVVPLAVVVTLLAVVFIKSIAVAPRVAEREVVSTPTPARTTPTPTAEPTREPGDLTNTTEEVVELPAGPRQLYKNFTDDEKREFIKKRADHIALTMGKRPYAFTPDALEYIKFWVDAFARRVGNNQSGLWRGDTRFILERGRGHAPLIIRSFKENRVPPVIGLYIPFIETEYTNIHSNNAAGAAGLFQFLGPTAEHYGVPSSERTDVAKMAPAAARYFRDNIMSFGDDSMSVALAIAGYNRAPESVKRDLRNVLNADNNEDKERNFWTLIANQGKLDLFFQNENKNYVPRFFAAAIIGETPWAFGIEMRPLSTYTAGTSESSGD